jgi:4a-hydroxytetrahydrobiopterin dehydratase
VKKFTKLVTESNEVDWSVLGGKLQKNYKFDNFDQAINFINKIADLAKTENHHPDIFNSYNQVTISLFTHDQNKITELDKEMSKKIDDLI